MNIESLRKHLAIKVMGWEINVWGQWVDKNDKTMCLETQWKPDENETQATMCFETFNAGSIDFVRTPVKKYRVDIEEFVPNQGGGAGKITGTYFHSKLSMAMSLASAKATGWKDD